MQFGLISIISLAVFGSALAAPSTGSPALVVPDVAVVEREAAVRPEINATEYLTFQAPAACKILKCASVLTEASCILEAITDDSISEAFECITKKTLCNCAACVKPLGKFLNKFNACDALVDEDDE